MADFGPLLPDITAVFDDEFESADSDDDTSSYARSLLFDFSAQGDGGFVFRGTEHQLHVVDDARSLMLWVAKALQTPRGEWDIYGPSYGTNLAKLGPRGYSELAGKAKGDVEECLLVHPLIDEIRNFTIRQLREPSAAEISFTIVDRVTGEVPVRLTI